MPKLSQMEATRIQLDLTEHLAFLKGMPEFPIILVRIST